MSQSQRPKKRVLAFIDGFNLYYGLLKDNPRLKWLDVKKLVQNLFPPCEVEEVNYFTAKVDDDGRLSPSAKRLRQDAYRKVLEFKGINLVYGRLELREKQCTAAQCCHEGDRSFKLPVEKMTDVNLALNLVFECQRLNPDIIVVISGDTDLLPALIRVRLNHRSAQKRLYIPCSEKDFKFRRVDEFGQNGWIANRLDEKDVAAAVMPETIDCGASGSISRPIEWV